MDPKSNESRLPGTVPGSLPPAEEQQSGNMKAALSPISKAASRGVRILEPDGTISTPSPPRESRRLSIADQYDIGGQGGTPIEGEKVRTSLYCIYVSQSVLHTKAVTIPASLDLMLRLF